nr:glycoside hydrolase family 38 C-terminal domain-containing protein [Leifsonia xyli]
MGGGGRQPARRGVDGAAVPDGAVVLSARVRAGVRGGLAAGLVRLLGRAAAADARGGGRWFLTQKLSWNDTNRMPHHTFWWEGIDGSRILAHFPPVDNYNCDLSTRQLTLAERQQAASDSDTLSYAPSGWGDGGGGPTREHGERAERMRDLEGVPRVRWGTPEAFFEELEAQLREPPVWAGELYLELHRGVATTQAAAKRGNRMCERLLREAELWCAAATVRTGADYPGEALRECWERVLLHQFHDSLPGSAIAWVYREMAEDHARVAEEAEEAEEAIAEAVTAMRGAGCADDGGDAETGDGTVLLDAGPLPVSGVPALGGGRAASALPLAAGTVPTTTSTVPTAPIALSDPRLRAIIAPDGRLLSLSTPDGPDLLRPGSLGNSPELHRDLPNRWDAWDIDGHHRRAVRLPDGQVRVTADGDGVRVERALTERSWLSQRISVEGGALRIETEEDWHEWETLLKLAFPFALRAAETVAETHFGHIRHPATANTSWEHARFEASTQRWLHLAEGGLAVSVANDVTPGYDVRLDRDDEGRPLTRLGVSLLRGPRYPDPETDQGLHTFTLLVRPGADIPDAIADGYALALPLRRVALPSAPAPLVAAEGEGVLVEAVKLAEDGSGDVIVRLYESLGRHGEAALSAGFPAAGARRVDLLERDSGEPLTSDGDRWSFPLRPFQLATVRIARRT